ncbi:hypothetical protein CapIbe_003158 [Capra ibex]|uniref:C-reactive protein n=1 Tax=Capra hircus TaxID=9925 RepID=UPI000846300E|nr:PREDICTED: C-reactive protein [Capra hircus]KAJ1064251.1 hypothetical protein K5549_014665 [Capra hircus]
MERLLWCFLALIGFSSVLGQTDLHKKAFVFPKETENSYVSLKTQLETPLKAFTVCLYFYTELAQTRSYSIFSYATRQQPNEILIFWSKGKGYTFGVHGKQVSFQSFENTQAPTHICASWESTSGIAELWVNGKPRVRKSLEKGASLGKEASIILGQEQDAFAGGFDRNQCLVGDIGDVNMWDFVLSPEEINTVYVGGNLSPNVLNWKALNYEAKGEVFVKPQLW